MTLAGLKYYLTHPMRIYNFLSVRGLLDWIPDKTYLKTSYWIKTKKKLNLEKPQTFNEKIQWLKVNDRKNLYTELTDKFEVRKHVAGAIGAEHLIPLVGGPWNSFEEIDLDALPQQFVLKCTHDSGGLVICRDKSAFDAQQAKKKIEKSMKANYYRLGREWSYKNIKPRIIAEQYMEDENSALGLTDYKFFCFNGKPEMIYISQGLEDHATARISFFDLQGRRMPFARKDYRPIEEEPTLPPNFEEMTQFAEKLAQMADCPFVRVDLYSIYGKTKFSEITFYPCGGMMPFSPECWDKKLGEWIKLPER